MRFITILIVGCLTPQAYSAALTEADISAPQDTITLVEETDQKRVYEFRQNGMLMMIKVIPKTGIPYYLVPAHGEAHFTDLSEIKQLYPQWTLIEW